MKRNELSLHRKEQMAASLKKLMTRKNLGRITIQELADDCGINRYTFYYHFQDIYDLLSWTFRQDFEKLPAFIVSKSYTAISSEWKRRHKDEEMTCPYEIESGCEFAEEVLTADAAQTTRTFFEQQQLQQDFAEVQELLVQLSPKQEELIELHFLEGWSNGELAQRFGVSPAAISKTIKKGLTKLRQLLLAAHQAEKQREAEELLI